uniref:Uncharacterized protein n=1 Tax=Tanacetum cinerariifolium TaxID=118510 RepID=A0A6L2P364_TANCI|nr:hypothetical protein [Tanacetum cinerariifolium]
MNNKQKSDQPFKSNTEDDGIGEKLNANFGSSSTLKVDDNYIRNKRKTVVNPKKLNTNVLSFNHLPYAQLNNLDQTSSNSHGVNQLYTHKQHVTIRAGYENMPVTKRGRGCPYPLLCLNKKLANSESGKQVSTQKLNVTIQAAYHYSIPPIMRRRRPKKSTITLGKSSEIKIANVKSTQNVSDKPRRPRGSLANHLNIMAFPLPVMEFSLPGEVLTTSEESSHWLKKRDAPAKKIALLLKSSSNCQSKSYDSYANVNSSAGATHQLSSGNLSSLAVGIPWTFNSQQSSPKLDATSAIKFLELNAL